MTLNTSHHALTSKSNNETEPPASFSVSRDTSVVRLRDCSNHERLGWARGHGLPFNGMQMTRTALWLVWDVGLLDHARRERLGRGWTERETHGYGE